MNTAAYLARIGLSDLPRNTTAGTLEALQAAHLTHVPYETLDIVRGVPLSLEEDALFDKIVTRNRGGFCFELNGLFAALLRALHFPVTEYFGRFLRDADPGVPCIFKRFLLRSAEKEGMIYEYEYAFRYYQSYGDRTAGGSAFAARADARVSRRHGL